MNIMFPTGRELTAFRLDSLLVEDGVATLERTDLAFMGDFYSYDAKLDFNLKRLAIGNFIILYWP